jgi:hypothetical protein
LLFLLFFVPLRFCVFWFLDILDTTMMMGASERLFLRGLCFFWWWLFFSPSFLPSFLSSLTAR